MNLTTKVGLVMLCLAPLSYAVAEGNTVAPPAPTTPPAKSTPPSAPSHPTTPPTTPAPAPTGPEGEHHHGTPPKEALDACTSKHQGDACSFTGHKGKQVDGQCHAPEGDATKPLACAPKHKGPPKEAIDACASKADGDACSFKNAEGKEHSGTCKAHHKDPGKPLACMTKHHKDKHEGKEGKE